MLYADMLFTSQRCSEACGSRSCGGRIAGGSGSLRGGSRSQLCFQCSHLMFRATQQLPGLLLQVDLGLQLPLCF